MVNLDIIKDEVGFIKEQWQISQREYAETDTVSCDPIMLLAYLDSLIGMSEALVEEVEELQTLYRQAIRDSMIAIANK